jgi:hypothetical protein
VKSDFRFLLLSIFLISLSFIFGYSYSKYSSNNNSANTVLYNPQKTDRPKLTLFGMSFCKSSNQVETSLNQIFTLANNKVDFEPHYLFKKITNLQDYCNTLHNQNQDCKKLVNSKQFSNITECQKTLTSNLDKCLNHNNYLKSAEGAFYTSLHGRQESNQNIRELCAWKLANSDNSKWWNFIKFVNQNCDSTNIDSCWSQQAKQAGIDIYKVTECFNKEAFTIIEKELELSTKLNINSAPYIILNNQPFPPKTTISSVDNKSLKINDQNFTSDKLWQTSTILTAICDNFTQPPTYCQQKESIVFENQPPIIDCQNN